MTCKNTAHKNLRDMLEHVRVEIDDTTHFSKGVSPLRYRVIDGPFKGLHGKLSVLLLETCPECGRA